MTRPRTSIDEGARRHGAAKDLMCGWIEKVDLSRNVGRPCSFKLSEVDERMCAGGAADRDAAPDRTGRGQE